MSLQYTVDTISLVKFRTPQACRSAGGVMNSRNDTHWGCLINKRKLVHWTIRGLVENDFMDGTGLEVCEPYTFATPREIEISLTLEADDCHIVCKEIFQMLGITILTGMEVLTSRVKFAAGVGGMVVASAFPIVGALVVGGMSANTLKDNYKTFSPGHHGWRIEDE